MATKPTVRVPVWASGGSTTDPGAGKEAAGWLVDERPPANWWNWVWNAMGQWLEWSETSIDDVEGDVASLLGTQSFIDTSSSTPSVPDANHIYATAVPKVAAAILSPAGVPTVSGNSIGVSAVAVNGQSIRVTFGRAFNGTDYIALVTPIGTLDRNYVITKSAANYITVSATQNSDDQSLNASLQDLYFDLIVIGRH